MFLIVRFFNRFLKNSFGSFENTTNSRSKLTNQPLQSSSKRTNKQKSPSVQPRQQPQYTSPSLQINDDEDFFGPSIESICKQNTKTTTTTNNNTNKQLKQASLNFPKLEKNKRKNTTAEEGEEQNQNYQQQEEDEDDFLQGSSLSTKASTAKKTFVKQPLATEGTLIDLVDSVGDDFDETTDGEAWDLVDSTYDSVPISDAPTSTSTATTASAPASFDDDDIFYSSLNVDELVMNF